MKKCLHLPIRRETQNCTEIPFLSSEIGRNYKAVNLWENRHIYTLLLGMQNGTTSLEGNLAMSNKSKYAFTLCPSIPASENLH